MSMVVFPDKETIHSCLQQSFFSIFQERDESIKRLAAERFAERRMSFLELKMKVSQIVSGTWEHYVTMDFLDINDLLEEKLKECARTI